MSSSSNNKLISFFTDPFYRFDWLSSKGFMDSMDSESYLRKKYRLIYGKNLNLDTPTLFNEKMQWLKLHDYNPLYPIIVDKYKFKAFVGEQVGKEFTIPTLGVYEHFDDIDWDSLPDKFVLKTNHDSGGVVICFDKNHFDKKSAKAKLEAKLRKNYFYGCREWCYKDVKPLIIAEPFISCENSFGKKGLIDYKFYCFSGKVEYLMVSFGEAEKQHINHKYDINFQSIDSKFRSKELVSADTFVKPPKYDEMVKIVQTLCKGYPHIRVDLYNVDGQIFVGELTLYSNGGFVNLSEEMDAYLGELTNLNLAYKS